jgi:hypothetical protein
MTGNFWQPEKFENSTSTGMIKSTGGIKVFPNPSKNGTFTIEMDKHNLTENELEIEIIDTAGKVVYEDTICKNETATIDIGQVRGIYILNVKDGDLLYSEKVMVR